MSLSATRLFRRRVPSLTAVSAGHIIVISELYSSMRRKFGWVSVHHTFTTEREIDLNSTLKH